MIDELEFNRAVNTSIEQERKHAQFDSRFGAPYENAQFLRAITTGSIAILEPQLKDSINQTYVVIGKLKALFSALAMASTRDLANGTVIPEINKLQPDLEVKISTTHKLLLKFLGREDTTSAE